jgi:peptidyl-dipeptidase Dcp
MLLMGACNTEKNENTMISDNPFFQEFDTEYGVPPFDKIENTHYLPAFEEGIKRQEEEIKAIVENEEAPTFDNTILAFDRSGEMLTRTASVFFNLLSADSNEELQNIAKEVTPLITAHSDNIMLNEELFNRVKAVYDARFD